MNKARMLTAIAAWTITVAYFFGVVIPLARQRQLSNPKLGLSHNLGGVPYNGVCAISIVGLEGAGKMVPFWYATFTYAMLLL